MEEKIPEESVQVHLYNVDWVLKPRGPMQKESLSLYIYEKLKEIYESWTDPKHGDNPDPKILIEILKKNLIEETTIAWDDFVKEPTKKKYNLKIIEDIEKDFGNEFTQD